MGQFICSHCSIQFKKKFNLQRHMTVHGFGGQNRISKNISVCHYCHFRARSSIHLKNHVLSAHTHGVESEPKNLHFSNEEEFLKWKEQIETQTRTSFYIRSSRKLHQKNGVVTVTYYRCTRYGNTHTGAGKRASWIKGSCKTGNYCPAEIKRRDEGNGAINVRYLGTHTGHCNEMRYLRLPKSVELLIAQKIKDGVDINVILDSIRSEAVNSETLQKKHFLTKKKIYNIIEKYNLSAAIRYHKDDIVSVDILTKKYESMTINPIVMYKKIGESHDVIAFEDMFLVLMTAEQREMLKKFGHEKICIDSTHNTNQYKVQLTSVYVIDEFGISFPVSYCISSKVDESTMTLFFKEMKRLVDVIKTKVFISDDAPTYYNAWRKVMTEVNMQLLCKWHIDRAWRKNLAKLPDKQSKCEVYATLRMLLEEPKKEEFENLLESFLQKLNSFPEFKNYFEKMYSNRPRAWAACYRQEAFLNTNIVLEASHRTLKHVFLKSRQNNRLDYLIQVLLKIVRDKTFNRMINLEEGHVNKYMNEINKRHKRFIEVNNITQISENEWKVLSRTFKNTHYIISKNPVQCSCRQKCIACNACVHTYACSCHDYFISHYVCKHIHAIAEFEKRLLVPTLLSLPQEVEIQEPIMNDFVCSQLEKENRLNHDEMDIITNQIAQIADLWSTTGVRLNDKEITRNIRKHTSAIIDILRNSLS